MKVLLLAVLLVLSMSFQIQKVSSTTCSWNNNYECPFGFAVGTRPSCDHTRPEDLGNGLFGMYVCTADSTVLGESYRVTLPVGGIIQSVNIMASDENNLSCDNGATSVGQQVFSAYCSLGGPGRLNGYWAITYKKPSNI